MTDLKIDELLDWKARQTPPEAGYPPARIFIANFKQQLQSQRRRARHLLGWCAAAATLLILLTAWQWLARIPTDCQRHPAEERTISCKASLERLEATERHFGSTAGIIFVNDNLLIFDRQNHDQINNYLVSIEIFSPGAAEPHLLEFATAGDDYIVLEDELIKGRIFLVCGDHQGAVLEITLRLYDSRQEKIYLREIMALEQLSTTRALDNGTRLRVDFCRRES